MTREGLIKELQDRGFNAKDVVIFKNPYYEDAIIGISQYGNVCYSFKKMIDYLIKNNNLNDDEAFDFLLWNAIRAFKDDEYKPNFPIIVYDD